MYHIDTNFSTWWQWMSFQERIISILVPNWQLVEKTEELRFCYPPASLELHLEDESGKLSNTENQMKSGVGSQPESQTLGNYRPRRGSQHSNVAKNNISHKKKKKFFQLTGLLKTNLNSTDHSPREKIWPWFKNVLHIHRFRICFSEATLIIRLLSTNPKDKIVTADQTLYTQI